MRCAACQATERSLPDMLQRRSGVIVHVTSIQRLLPLS